MVASAGRRRTRPTSRTETSVLVGARRRCALCYGLFGDLSVKPGQLAHVDRDPSNSSVENLAFLCLDHHDQYDSKTSQSKRLTPDELRIYRAALEDVVRRAFDNRIDPCDIPISPPPPPVYQLVDDALFLPVGHASSYFATDGDVTCELTDVRVLVAAGQTLAIRALLPILEQAARSNIRLLVVADALDQEALSTMVVNSQRGVLAICVVELTHEFSRWETRRAISRFSSATIFGDESGKVLESAVLRDLGSIACLRANLKSTILKKAT